MNQLGKIILSTFSIILIVYLTTLLMGLFNVPMSGYGSYLGWGIALILFFAVLPSRVGSIFD